MDSARIWTEGLTMRLANAEEVELANKEGFGCNEEDGAGALLCGDELVAVFNEYGTAWVVPGTEFAPTKGECETLFELMVEWTDSAAQTAKTSSRGTSTDAA